MQQARVWAARAYEAGRLSFGEEDERVVQHKEWMVRPAAPELQPMEKLAMAMMTQMQTQGARRGGYRPPFFPPGFPFGSM